MKRNQNGRVSTNKKTPKFCTQNINNVQKIGETNSTFFFGYWYFVERNGTPNGETNSFKNNQFFYTLHFRI